MKLVVLGSGTCLGPPPGATPRMPPLFALDVGDGAPAWILFECSEGARFRLPAHGIDPSSIAHVAISHPHADHAVLPPFLQGRSCEAIYRPGADLGLTLYLPRASAEALPSLWSWHQPEDEGRPPSRYRLDIVPVSDGFTREILPGVTLSSHAVHHGHGNSPAVAYRVSAHGLVVVYSGDTGLCAGIERAADGADLFVCEAASRIGVDMARDYGHLNPRQAAELAMSCHVKQLLLTHYTGLDDDAAVLDDARASGFPGRVQIARDGDEVSIAPGSVGDRDITQ